MTALPFVTADLPGSGGALRRTPEDFRVDEVPAYLPSGEGTHLYLRVEKRGRTTRDAIRALAAALGVPERDAGYAGLKDREAVTTQWLSFPVARDPEPTALESPGLRVLEVSRHGNKLRPGHARGNRFALTVRGGDLERARAAAAALATRGFPNFFGPQRFGAAGRNAVTGKALLLGQRTPEAGRAARDRFLRRLCISAYQSELFNRWLTERLADGLFAAALAACHRASHDTGAATVQVQIGAPYAPGSGCVCECCRYAPFSSNPTLPQPDGSVLDESRWRLQLRPGFELTAGPFAAGVGWAVKLNLAG